MKWKKALSVTCGVLCGLLFALCLLLLVASLIMRSSNKDNATWLFGYGMFQIVTGSMEPEINVGDVVVGKKTDLSAVRPGDNIVFRRDGKLITHKVVSVNGDGTVTTRGVANESNDAPVTEADFVARQQFVLRGFGKLLDFVRSKYGFLLFILLPLGGLILGESVSLGKKLALYRKDREEEKKRTEDAEKLAGEIERLKRELEKKERIPACGGEEAPQGNACGPNEGRRGNGKAKQARRRGSRREKK